MIFVTVGTQKFQFDRLIREIDRLCEKGAITDNIEAQVGYCDYQPKFYNFYKMMDPAKMEKLIKSADLVITHGGTSSIFHALKLQKKVIAVPRLQKYKEHVDDHQVEILKILEGKNYISVAWEIESLHEKIEEITDKSFSIYQPSSHSLIHEIMNYINSEL